VRVVVALALVGCSFNPRQSSGAQPGDAPVNGDDDAIVAQDGTRIPDAPGLDASTIDGSLIAWYKMESLGSGAIDSTGHGHTGTCASSCPSVVAGHSGSGFQFDGTTRIDIGDGGAFDTAAFTVATWVEYTSLTFSGFECPVGKVLDSTIYNSWELCYDMATQKWLYDTVAPTTPYAFAELEPSSGPAIGTWYHTAMVWDGSNKTLYIDGSAAASATNVQVGFAVGEPLSFGADIDNDNQSSPFVGVMDDLRIYSRALSASEIATLASE
jgi:hypothetical protein